MVNVRGKNVSQESQNKEEEKRKQTNECINKISN